MSRWRPWQCPLDSALRAYALQDRQDVAAELLGVLAHREMAELLHHHDLRAGDLRRRPLCVLRCAREIVLAGEQIERADARIDDAHPAAEIAIDAVEVQVTLEHAGTTLHVHPECLPARDLGALRREQSRDQPRADLAAIDIGAMEPG